MRNISIFIIAIISFIIICFSHRTFAQTPQQNLEKYWYYRYRLLGNNTEQLPGFVKIGDQRGMSLVCSNWDKHKEADPVNKTCSHKNTIDADSVGKMRWGDGTITHGYYLSVLATGWKLMEDTYCLFNFPKIALAEDKCSGLCSKQPISEPLLKQPPVIVVTAC